MKNGFALNHDQSLRIYYFCVNRQAKTTSERCRKHSRFFQITGSHDFETLVSYMLRRYRIIHDITKTRLYNFDPFKPHFYIVKLGFTGVYIIFLIPAQNIDCGYSLEPPRRGGFNEYPQSMFWAEIWTISDFFVWKFSFFGGKVFSIFEYINVFVMETNIVIQNMIVYTISIIPAAKKKNKHIFSETYKYHQNVVCCSCDWHFRGSC